MKAGASRPTLAGVDGCRAGWVAAIEAPNRGVALEVFGSFGGIVDALPADAIIAVDMPIGLPERIHGTGRAAEIAARAVLARRRSSVFPIPARAAFAGPAGPFERADARAAAYRQACRIAREHSDRAKAFAIQAFAIFPKIREIDAVLRNRRALCARVLEAHPEVAFAILNDGAEMRYAKRAKTGQVFAGLAERRAVLRRHGLSKDVLESRLPAKVGRDDWLDACAMLLVAGRFAGGEAVSFPDPPDRDAHGLPIAIWA